MSKKVIFMLAVLVLLIVVIVFYHDQLTLEEMLLSFGLAGSFLGNVWLWFNGEEKSEAFEEETGVPFKTYKRAK